MRKQNIKYLYCKGTKYAKEGFRKTLNRGKIQKFKCLECNRNFTADGGFYRMRNSPKTITMSVDMYLSNLSSRKMRNQLRRHFSHKISHVSILDWVRKYVLKVQKYAETLNYSLGSSFYADETFIQRDGKQDRFWACVDWDTRLITGIHYSLAGNPQEAMKFLNNAISKGK